MKNIVLKLVMICLFSGCYAVFVAWENGGFSQLHDFQAIESNGMSAYLHQTSAATMQAEKKRAVDFAKQPKQLGLLRRH